MLLTFGDAPYDVPQKLGFRFELGHRCNAGNAVDANDNVNDQFNSFLIANIPAVTVHLPGLCLGA